MKTQSIFFKVSLLSVSSLFLFVFLGGTSYVKSGQLMDQLDELAKVQVPAVRSMGLVDMMHDGIRGVVMEMRVSLLLNDVNRMNELGTEMNEKIEWMDREFKNLESLPLDPAVRNSVEAAKPSVSSYVQVGRHLVSDFQAGNRDSQKLKEFNALYLELEESLEKLGAGIAEQSNKSRDQGKDVKAFIIISLVGALFVLSFISIYVIQQTRKSLKTMAKKIESFTFSSQGVVEILNESTQNVKNSCDSQLSAVHETVSAMAEINSMIEKTSENSQSAASLALNAVQRAKSSLDHSAKLQSAMSEVLQATERFGKIIESVNLIRDRSKAIDDIVLKTQLLSFNASIEASRAGVQGAGFAVVAEEVGSLAKLSGQSSQQIQSLLVDAQDLIQKTLGDLKDQIDHGIQFSNQMSGLITHIHEEMDSLSLRVSEISSAVQQQSAGMGQITESVASVDLSAKKNAREADNGRSGAQKLDQEMMQLVEICKEVNDLAA